MTPSDYTFVGQTLLLMMGLPYSGKTTKALELSRALNAPLVSPDAIRLALSGERYLPALEPTVWWIARMLTRSLFLAGHQVVIVDATHNTRKRRDAWRTSEGWDVLVLDLEVDSEVCRDQAVEANDLEILPVIARMAGQRQPLEEDETPALVEDLLRLWSVPR